MSHDSEKDPGENLSTIVRAGDELEERSHGNRTLLRSISLAHSAELQMDSTVDALADEHTNHTNVHNERVLHSRVEGMTKSITNLLHKR